MCTERLVSASKFIDSVIKSRAADPIYCSGLLNQVARFLHRRLIVLTTANETVEVYGRDYAEIRNRECNRSGHMSKSRRAKNPSMLESWSAAQLSDE